MNPKDKAARSTLIWKLVAQYPNVKIEPESIAVYIEGTAEMSLGILDEALTRAAHRSPTFFPPLPLIQKCARKVAALEAGILSPEQAWEWVCGHMWNSGEKVHADPCPVAERAVAIMGGFKELGQKNVAERNWTKKEFIAIYKSLYRRASEDALTMPSLLADPGKPRRLGPDSNGFERIGS